MQTNGKEQYVEFGISNEQYAIPIQDIHEVIKIQDITPIPNTRDYVKGIINLRGTIIPVISLRSLFGLVDEAFTKTSRIIIVHHQEEEIGIIVDYVNKVTTFSNREAPPGHVGRGTGRYFTGIGVSDNGLVGILQLDELLL